MNRIMIALAVTAYLMPATTHAATSAQLCESAKLKAASTFSQCRLKADSVYAKTEDATKRDSLYNKCDDSLVKAYAIAESKYGLECPTRGEAPDVRDYLKQCSSDVVAATQPGGTVPDYVLELSACNTTLSSSQAQLTTCNGDKATCQTSLATAQAGTATTAQVLSGRTFTSSAGVGAAGTMPNNGAVTLTPGTSDQAIAVGYHNGSGKCAGDTDLLAGNIVAGVNLFGVNGTGLPGQVLKTGQTTCYDAAGAVIACAGTGQDGEFQRGRVRSFADNGDGTITDNVTGLMWEKLSNDGSIHDKDDTAYTWAGSFTKIATLNSSGGFAGYTDWRVPNKLELLTLAKDDESSNPRTYPIFATACPSGCTVLTCSCTTPGGQDWASTSFANFPSYAWYVDFVSSNMGAHAKTSTRGVRAVRGGS